MPETGVRERHRDLSGLRRGGQGHRIIEDPVVIVKILTPSMRKAAWRRRPSGRGAGRRLKGLFD
ncbi:MAG: hypothetical protein QNK18_15925 [Gammaproteobacteria bacterium]|nr:hypothetical protein [Gammaproteobacteria bacterium]MDJ0892667.1 hypothetical protein [Gammaproteobacteria bacterium]